MCIRDREADIHLDIETDGEKGRVNLTLDNDDLAELLQTPSVKKPLEERLYSDYLVDRKVYKLTPKHKRKTRPIRVIQLTKRRKKRSKKSKKSKKSKSSKSKSSRKTPRPKTKRIHLSKRSSSKKSKSSKSSMSSRSSK